MVAPAARGSAHLSFAVPWVAAADDHLSSMPGGQLGKAAGWFSCRLAAFA
jgi:hypothetical protein